jgi:hypothetical protein
MLERKMFEILSRLDWIRPDCLAELAERLMGFHVRLGVDIEESCRNLSLVKFPHASSIEVIEIQQ